MEMGPSKSPADDSKALLSVIVPALNEEREIAETLKSLAPARAAGCEVLVVDGGSQDGTVAAARPLADRVLRTTSGRAHQMNAGASAAKGTQLWFVHADTRVPPQAWAAVLRREGQGWGRFRVRLNSDRWIYRLIERGIDWRAQLTGIATGDQTLFVDRETFDRVGGFPDWPLMEDLEITRRLRSLCPMISLEPAVLTSARRWQRHGVLRTVILMWWLRLQWWLGVPPNRLARRYRGQ